MSKVIGIVSILVMIVSICLIDSVSNIPLYAAAGSLAIFIGCAVANGWFSLSESEDE